MLSVVALVIWWHGRSEAAYTIKEGVVWAPAPPFAAVFPQVAVIYRQEGERAAVVTSGTDSHTTGLHPEGMAADLRTWTLEAGAALRIVDRLNRELGPVGIQAVLESDHIHVELDEKGVA